MQGCFERDGVIGAICMQTFTVYIRNLDKPTNDEKPPLSDYCELSVQFTDWPKVLEYMHDTTKKPFIECVSDYFLRKLISHKNGNRSRN